MSDALMAITEDHDRLSQIETAWTIIFHAHSATLSDRHDAQQQMIARYGKAIQRYLFGAFRDEAAAEETFQEFVIRFLRGDYGSAHPEKGCFRGFLKVVLSRLVADHYRKLSRRRESSLDTQTLGADDGDEQSPEFLEIWRDELLTQTWHRLAEEEKQSGKPWMTVLRLRVEKPHWRSHELAEELAAEIGKAVTANRLRVLLHRSRGKFANHLIDVVAESLGSSSLEDVEDELAEIRLLQYCQSVLEQRKATV